jgi:signal transduction histidine kinase
MDIAQKLLDLAYRGKGIDTVAEAAGNEILTLRERVKELEAQLQGGNDDVAHGKD